MIRKKIFTVLIAALSMTAAVAQSVPTWLKDGIIYHIYPSTFKDSDGDGIGDLNGIRSQLPYIKSLGANTIWMSPIFCSKFEDGGYDITDFYRIDERFGSNTDLVELVKEAHAMGIRVCLDLVAGHTSDKHPWFVESGNTDKNLQHSDYYIWTDGKDGGKPEKKFVDNNAPRNGYFLKNYYDIQPALNYGYLNPDPAKPWQQAYDAPGPRAVRQEIKNIIAFWCDKGVDGFRCDMAASLVKGDDKNHSGNMRLWHEMRDFMDKNYPEAILISEWSQPHEALKGGFDIDLIIHNGIGNKLYRPLVCQTSNDGVSTPCYFDPNGKDAGQLKEFVEVYTAEYNATKDLGFASMPTCSHDIWRLNRFDRSNPEILKSMLTFFNTMPWVPIIYYGEEIGMRNIEDAPDKEGSFNVKNRSSCRTPMQWNTEANAGFSTASAEKLYLPIDSNPLRPNVACEETDKNSILNYVKGLLDVRKSIPALGTRGSWTYVGDLSQAYPMVYMRELDGEKYIVAINALNHPVKASFKAQSSDGKAQFIYGTSKKVNLTSKAGKSSISMPAMSAAIMKL